MCKRVFELLLILSISLSVCGGLCFADAGSDLNQAESYVQNGLFSQAEAFCVSIAQSNPGTDSALKAQGKLAAVYIMTKKMPQADAEVDKLISTFKGNAELPTILYGTVLRYKSAREFQRAQNLSQRICQEFPSSEQAQRIQLDSGKDHVFGLLENGQFKEAEEAVNNLAATSGSNPAMPKVLFKIAREFKESDRYDETMRIYQKIAQNYPKSEFGDKAKIGVDKLKIWNQIRTGDVTGAQAALEKLIRDYKDEDDLPHTVHGVALKLEESGYYEQAKALYQRVKKDYPDADVAAMVPVDLKKCDIRAMIGKSSFSEVTQQLNFLKKTFADHWHLPLAIYQMGEEYYKKAIQLESQGSAEPAKAIYRNAAGVLDIVINELPHSSATPEACDYAAVCYERLGEHAKANQCYQIAIDNFPGFRHRGQMMFMMGRNYGHMKKAGAMSAAEADTKTKAIYEKLLIEYPQSKRAEQAKKLLGR